MQKRQNSLYRILNKKNIMKYTIGKNNEIPGPGGKPLNFTSDEKPASFKEVENIITACLNTGKNSDD